MTHQLSVDIHCAADAGDFLGRIDMEDGATSDLVLRNGTGEATLPSRPTRLTLSMSHVVKDPEATSNPSREVSGDAVAVDASTLFGEGIPIPTDGRLVVQVVWGSDCHGELHIPEEDGRFTSFEHIQCAYLAGRDGDGEQLPAPTEVSFDTPWELNGTELTFGELICLAGDFFAHLDRESAALFPEAWPPMEGAARWLAGSDYRSALLVEEDGMSIRALLDTIHRNGPQTLSTLGELFKTASDAAFHSYPVRRYLALASQNYCHFANPEAQNDAHALYRGYHRLALARARAAGEDKSLWCQAVFTEAFACHFLTDLFASGHMRTPRRQLGERFGILRGSLRMSKAMHDEDNALGLWCTAPALQEPRRVVWRAYGDGRLLTDAANPHLSLVQEAVRRSVWELHEAQQKRTITASDSAENRIPYPLPPRQAPLATDILPGGALHSESARGNHYPMYIVLENGHIAERQGDGGDYRDLEPTY